MLGHRRIKVEEDNGTTRTTEVFLPQIRDVVGFLNGVWDLNIYADCIDGSSKLGDVDGSTEIYGHTLHIEFKRSFDNVNAGQLVKAVRQARHSNITTLFVFGETNRPNSYMIFTPTNLEGSGLKKGNVVQIRKILKEWSKWAKKNSLVTGKTEREDWAIAKRYMEKKTPKVRIK